MSSRSEKNKNALRDRHQSILSEMLKEDANRLCADCNAKGPRWASWNIGVFLCIRCAGIHRNLGVHISKVKSVNLDSWTPEQMDHIVQWGNQRCKDVYECYLPKDFCRPQGDSAMETFIRSKYERKLYIIKGDISTAGLNPNRSIVNQPKQDDKPKVSSTNKVERPSKTLQDQKTKSRSKPMVSLESPSTAPVVAPSVSKTTSSSVDDLLSMGDFQGASNNGPANNSQTSDLFGLDSCSGNEFHTQTTQQQSNGASAQDPFSTNGNVTTEQDLFPDDSSAQPAKSAKDTIMSLYATGRSQPSSNAMYGIPGGVYMANGTANNSQGAYNNHQQYQNQPQFHGNSHFNSASQGQMMMPQQQPLHQQMQQMSMNQGQMAFNSNQQYPNHANLPGNQYQQPRPMTMPMYSQNMNNARPMGGHQMGMVQSNWAMPSNQQPILANGNPNVMAPSGMTQNTMGHGNMGHTLSTQLWN